MNKDEIYYLVRKSLHNLCNALYNESLSNDILIFKAGECCGELCKLIDDIPINMSSIKDDVRGIVNEIAHLFYNGIKDKEEAIERLNNIVFRL